MASSRASENPVQVVQAALACAARLWPEAAHADGILGQAATELGAQFELRGHRALAVETHVRTLGEILGRMAWYGRHEGLIHARLACGAIFAMAAYERDEAPRLRTLDRDSDDTLSPAWRHRIAEFGLPIGLAERLTALVRCSAVSDETPGSMVAGHYRTLFTELLDAPEVLDDRSVAARLVRFVAVGRTPGFHPLLVRVPRTPSVALLDRWNLGPGGVRANAWILLDAADELSAVREAVFHRQLAPHIHHVAIVLGFPVEARPQRDQQAEAVGHLRCHAHTGMRRAGIRDQQAEAVGHLRLAHRRPMAACARCGRRVNLVLGGEPACLACAREEVNSAITLHRAELSGSPRRTAINALQAAARAALGLAEDRPLPFRIEARTALAVNEVVDPVACLAALIEPELDGGARAELTRELLGGARGERCELHVAFALLLERAGLPTSRDAAT